MILLRLDNEYLKVKMASSKIVSSEQKILTCESPSIVETILWETATF